MAAHTSTIPALTVEDIDQVAEGIECFIMNSGDPEVDPLWQPYVDKLKEHRATLAAAPELLAACRFALETFPGANDDERAVFLAAIAKAEGR